MSRGNFDLDDLEIFEDVLSDLWFGNNVRDPRLQIVYDRRIAALSASDVGEIENNVYLQWSIVSPELFDLAKPQLALEGIIYNVINLP